MLGLKASTGSRVTVAGVTGVAAAVPTVIVIGPPGCPIGNWAVPAPSRNWRSLQAGAGARVPSANLIVPVSPAQISRAKATLAPEGMVSCERLELYVAVAPSTSAYRM